MNHNKTSGLQTYAEKRKKERQLLEEKIGHLRGRIKTLEQEKELLIVQLVMQEDIRRENERLKKNEKIRS